MQRRSFLKARRGARAGRRLWQRFLGWRMFPLTILINTTSAGGRRYPTGFTRGPFSADDYPSWKLSWR